MVVLDTESSWKIWHFGDNPVTVPETGAGEGGAPKGHPSTKEGVVGLFVCSDLNRNDGCIFWGMGRRPEAS